jgi:hypothetical protein
LKVTEEVLWEYAFGVKKSGKSKRQNQVLILGKFFPQL